MSLFLGPLTDDDGFDYEYGHCYADDDNGNDAGCGMEYVYYPHSQTLTYCHDAVGIVTLLEGFTYADIDALEESHAPHMRF